MARTRLRNWEAEKDKPEEMEIVKDEENGGKKKKAKNKKNKKVKKDKPVAEVISEVREVAEEDSDLEEEEDGLWMPPAGEHWDEDDGGERWGSGEESGAESDEAGEEETEEATEEAGKEAEGEAKKLSSWTKRMSLEIGPSSFASRKKKKKTTPSS